MIFIIILMVFLFIAGKSANMAQMINKDDCKMHKWEYDDTGFLICSVCKKRPGHLTRDNNE